MNIRRLELNDPGQSYYNLRDKLSNHVIKRSEEAFKKAAEARQGIKTKEEFEEYIKDMRAFFIDSLGTIPYDKTLPLNAKTTGVIEEDGLKIEKVIFETRPNVYMTGNLYIPEKRKEPCGAVLFQIGHADTGKTHPQYQRVARTIASAGLIVFIIEPVGQGERFSYFEPNVGAPVIGGTIEEHQYTGEQCVLTGDSIARYFIADAMRSVDYLISRPEVDSEKIGATGSSGGGTATCHAMICDERIKAAAPGTFVTTRRDNFYTGTAQDSEQIWMGATEKGFDHHEAVMCFAPKPLLLLTVASDFFPLEGAKEIIDVTKRFWGMYGEEEKLGIVTDASMHCYTDNLAKEAAKFFAMHLNGEEREFDESLVKTLPAENLRCTKSGQVRCDYPDSKFFFEENLEKYNSEEKPEKTLKEFLTEKIYKDRTPVEINLRPMAPIFSEGLKMLPYMWFTQPQMPNFGMMFSAFDKKATETVICLWENGTNSIEEHIYKIRQIVKEGKQAFVLDLTGMGKCEPTPLNSGFDQKTFYGAVDKLTKDLFFLGDSLCAIRMYDLLVAADMIREKICTDVSIYAEGVCAHYARLYNAVCDGVATELKNPAPDYKEIVESRYYESYNIAGALLPGIAKYYK